MYFQSLYVKPINEGNEDQIYWIYFSDIDKQFPICIYPNTSSVICFIRFSFMGYYTTKPSFTNFCWNLSLWNQTLQCSVCHWEGRECACPVMVHATTGSPILGTYTTAVVIIKLKMIANPCEVIAEAEMRWKYILFTSHSLMFLCSESL